MLSFIRLLALPVVVGTSTGASSSSSSCAPEPQLVQYPWKNQTMMKRTMNEERKADRAGGRLSEASPIINTTLQCPRGVSKTTVRKDDDDDPSTL
jgi:hypothetical protein